MILDMSMVKIAYYQNEAVGFFIGMPNYHNKLYKRINLLTLFEILKIKKKSTDYVMLYMEWTAATRGLERL